jgi:hypothetical protein
VSSFVRRALRGPNLAYAFIAEPTEAEVNAARILARARFGDVFRKIIEAGILKFSLVWKASINDSVSRIYFRTCSFPIPFFRFNP